MKKLGLIIASVVFSASASGEVVTPPDATGSLENGIYTITVPAGEQKMICADNMEGINGSSVLRKRGAGTLFSSILLKSYPGEIRVEEGAFLVSTNGHLGTSAGKTVVSNGASVVIYAGSTAEPSIHPDGYMVSSGSDQMFYTDGTYKEQWVLNGTGTDEYPAAIYIPGAYQGSSAAFGSVELLGDTRITTLNMPFYMARNSTLTMNGWTLYFNHVPKGNGSGFSNCAISKPGHIVIESGPYCIKEGGATWGGDASNTLTLKSGVIVHIRAPKDLHNWTLKVENGANLKCDYGSPTWNGPVELNAVIDSTCQQKILSQFLGDITGTGGFNASKGSLALGGINSYTGQTKLNGTEKDATFGSEIRLNRPESYPAGNENGIELIDANLVLDDSTSHTFNLPIVKVDKNGVLKSTTPSCYSFNKVEKIEKTGDGVLELNASVTVSNVNVSAGTLRIIKAHDMDNLPYGNAGLMLGTIDECKTDDVDHITGYNIHCAEGPGPWVTPSAWWDASKPAQSWGAKGYLWNRDSKDVTWSIGVSAYSRTTVCIDGNIIFKDVGVQHKSGDTYYYACTNIVLTPGPHEFRMITGNNENPSKFGTHEHSWTNPDTGVKYTVPAALFYDPSGCIPMNQNLLGAGKGAMCSMYDLWTHSAWGHCKPLCDSGNGYVFTTDATSIEDFRASSACEAALPKIITAEFAAGTILDLGGNRRYWVENLIGLPKIENGSEFCISNTWTVSASELEDTHIVTQSGLEFSEGARLNIQDVDQLRHAGKSYVLCTSEKVIVGKPSLGNSAVEAGWSLAVGDDAKTLELRSRRGMVIIIK